MHIERGCIPQCTWWRRTAWATMGVTIWCRCSSVHFAGFRVLCQQIEEWAVHLYEEDAIYVFLPRYPCASQKCRQGSPKSADRLRDHVGEREASFLLEFPKSRVDVGRVADVELVVLPAGVCSLCFLLCPKLCHREVADLAMIRALCALDVPHEVPHPTSRFDM